MLEIRLFGPLLLLRSDGQAAALPGRKDRALLAYLAAHPGVVFARDRLIELIWPDAADGAGRASLRQSLSTIRKAIGDEAEDLIVTNRDTVSMAANGLVTDLAMLEGLAAEPISTQSVPEGEFLEGMTAISPSFDTWRATEQARLTSIVCKILNVIAELAEADRRFADAAALLARAISIDPLAEPTHRRLMAIHAAQGRTDSALRQFRTLEQVLETELGVRPEKETLDLVQEIRARRQKGDHTTASRLTSPAPDTEAMDSDSELRSNLFEIDLSLPETPSIAVLPFTNMSADPEQEFFSDGISEDITTALSKIEDLLVVARNSAFTYKGQPTDVKQISREQGVRYVLEGSVRKAGNRVRITAQLIDAITGHHIWAERYDRDLDDIFAIQDQITHEVSIALEVRLRSGEQAEIWASGTRDVEAWECVRQGMESLNRITPEDHVKARQLLHRAPELDPDYPMAWAALGWYHFHDASYTTGHEKKSDREAALDLAIDAARQALDLDPSCADACGLLALCFLSRENYDKAVEMTEKAVDLAPNLAEILATSAVVLSKSGQPDRAFDLIRKAMRRCPIYPAWYLYVLATTCRLLGRNEDAAAVFEEAVHRNPDNLGLHVGLASVLGELNRQEEAQTPASVILKLDPDFSIGAYVSDLSYRDPAELERFAAGLRAVGLPD